jgi:type III pantothenate kinase
MLLVVDAGNTNVKFAVYERADLRVQWRLRMDAQRTADEYAALLLPLLHQSSLSPQDIQGVCLACVVPTALPAILRLFRRTFAQEPLQVTGNADIGLEVAYEPPDAVGADRLADAVAALHRVGAPCIVIDFGTATTFNAIREPHTPGGLPVYLGGAICLGIGVSLEALFARAAKIPAIALDAPPRVIGSNTAHALQSGIAHGYSALVDGMVGRFRAEMKAPNCPVIATGGHAALIAATTSTIQRVEPQLTLDGLRLIYEKAHPDTGCDSLL